LKKAKIVLSFLLTILMTAGLLVVSYFPAQAGSANYTTIRVKLSVGSGSTSYITSMNVTINGSYSIKEKSSVTVGGKAYTVKISGSTIALYNGSTKLYSGSSFTLVPSSTAFSNTIRLYNLRYSANLSYLGNMQFKAYAKVVSGSTKHYIMAINHVNIEQYLYGVVPHEMSNAFPIESLKAQAVCARGYAIQQLSSGASYDVVDTSADQVYKGYNSANNNAISAVNATQKQVVTYKGNIICTYFAASNGGATEATSNVWSAVTPLAYQVVKADPYDLRNPSTPKETKTFAKIVKDDPAKPDDTDTAINLIKSNYIQPKLKADGKVDKDGDSISVPSEFTLREIISMTGTVPADHLKFAKYNCACTHVETISMKVKVGTYVKVADDPETEDEENTKAQDVTYTLSIPADKFLDWDIFHKSSLRVYFISEIKDTSGNVTGYTLLHSRYGHGCGLSQRGAQQMAKEGWDYKKILDFYFPNTLLKETNITPPVYTPPAITGVGQVTSASLNVRSGPGTSYSVLDTISKNTNVAVVKSSYTTDWHQILYGSTLAYVHKNYISLLSGTKGTLSAAADLKTTASAASATKAALKAGATVSVYGTSGDYVYVLCGGAVGYVLKSALSATEPSPSVSPSPSPSTTTKPAIVGFAKIKAATVYLYSEANTAKTKAATLTLNKTLEITVKNCSSGWHQVWYNNQLAYVEDKYVTLTSGTASTVAANSAVLKKSASSSAATLATLKKGAAFRIYAYSGSYMYVNYNGVTGYILKNALNPTKPTIKKYAYVASNTLRVRSKATTSSTALAVLKRNAIAEVVNYNYSASWAQIWYNSNYAYVYKKYLKLYTTKSGTVSSTTLKVRASASTSSKTLLTLKNGYKVVVLSRNTTWSRVYYNGKAGYVLSRYLKIS
jgi:SpoIID/LytB domain protein